jgi:hypothetical protein
MNHVLTNTGRDRDGGGKLNATMVAKKASDGFKQGIRYFLTLLLSTHDDLYE